MNNKITISVLAGAILMFQAPCPASTSSEVIRLNNKGVNALVRKDWQAAVSNFQLALKMAPHYGMARKNLSIAYNNIALDSKSKNLGIKHFHKSVFLDPENTLTQLNLSEFIKLRFEEDPSKFGTRVKLADMAEKNNDLLGAYVELKLALKLNENEDVRNRLNQLCKKVKGSSDYQEFEKVLLNPDDLAIISNKPIQPYAVLDGFLKQERKELIDAIQKAEEKGIGTKSYKSAFLLIEEQVQKGASEKSIRDRVETIRNSLNEQLSK